MNMRQFTGTDMRDAMRQIRAAFGPEAVILDTRRCDGRIQVTAATDLAASGTPATGHAVPPGDADGDCLRIDEATGIAYRQVERPRAGSPAEMQRISDEVQSIRCLLEAQLARLVWDDRARRTPEVASVMRNLAQLGLDTDVARQLADETLASQRDGSWTSVLRTLVDRLPVAPDDPGDGAGTWAICGPTGAGKTTTIAKLAARHALQHGADSVGLVTMDCFRIAAREQLETYGQILGVPVLAASSAAGLAEALRQLDGRELVLVDTAGMSQHDPRLREQLGWLAQDVRPVRTLLALPANAQAGSLRQIVMRYSAAAPAAAVLTKTDEATSLGPALSTLIRAGLPLAWVANGQRVPEDLHLLRNRQTWLVKMAVELMRQDPALPGEQEIAQRYEEQDRAFA